MRAFSNRRRQGNTACGYCRQTGHSIGDCPHIKYDHDEWAAFRVPHKSESLKYSRWFLGDYTYWVKQVNKYYPKFLAAQERKANPTTARAARAAPKCGFCRSPDHNRRNCPEMAQVEADLKSANQNWRQALYDRLVTDLGLGVGAAVKIQQRSSYYNRNSEPEESIVLITGMDLSKCNLFASRKNVGYDYAMAPVITVLAGGRETQLQLGTTDVPFQSNCGKVLLTRTNSWYGYADFVETIGRCEAPLDEEWVKEGLKDEFEWLLKKKTQEKLDDENIISAIDYWKVA